MGTSVLWVLAQIFFFNLLPRHLDRRGDDTIPTEEKASALTQLDGGFESDDC